MVTNRAKKRNGSGSHPPAMSLGRMLLMVSEQMSPARFSVIPTDRKAGPDPVRTIAFTVPNSTPGTIN